jgi:hypothetical protein
VSNHTYTRDRRLARALKTYAPHPTDIPADDIPAVLRHVDTFDASTRSLLPAELTAWKIGGAL